jgi:hypothetical protein
MNTVEARRLLMSHIQKYTSGRYEDLVKDVGYRATTEVVGNSGDVYQLQLKIFWDGIPGGTFGSSQMWTTVI